MRGQKVWRKGASAMTDCQNTTRLCAIRRRMEDEYAHFWYSIAHSFWAFTLGLLIVMLAVTALFPPPPVLVWNSSASAPVGLYYVESAALLVRNGSQIEPGDMVVAWPPKAARMLAAERHYLPSGVPLVKRVAAANHDAVCADGDQITIDGGWIIARRKRDAKGRALPWWQGCHVLQEGELFLMMEEHPSSFDGRYFGITSPKDVIGKATLIWPR